MNRTWIAASSISVFLGLFAYKPAQGQTTWHVDDNCTSPGSGSVADPFCAIQAGIEAAIAGDTVLVHDGTYTGPGNRDISFQGKAITVRSENGAGTTIIDCGGTESEPHRAFNFDSGETSVARLVGLTIRNGYASSNGPVGGAVRCLNNSSPTIESCTFTDNSSSGNGGAIYIDGASPTIQDCLFSGNISHYGGGGVGCSSSSAVIQRCTFTGNAAIEGGGIFTSNDPPGMEGFPLISDCVITGNTTTGSGGGITAEGHPTIRNCTIAGNSSHYGGGIFGNDGDRTIINCRITENYASITGGGLYFNDAKGDSGVKLYNTLVSGNEAAAGGVGGFLRQSPYAGGPAFIQNCIFWDNLPDQLGGEIYLESGAPTSITYSDIQGGFSLGVVGCGYGCTYANNINETPNFVDSDGPDGDPATYADNNYRLQFPSTLIDAANNAGLDSMEVDLDGVERFVNDPQTADSGLLSPAHDCAVADMGPYEFQALDQDCNCNGIEDFQDINIYHTSEDCDANGVPDDEVCQPGEQLAVMLLSVPEHEKSLWRDQKNTIRFTFACDITTPGDGQVPIQEMLSDGDFSTTDHSAEFTYTIENGNVLRIREDASTLVHRTWYAVRNTGSWSGVANFEVQYVVQAGDANDDGRVQYSDLGLINTGVPTDPAADNDRRDINGDGKTLSDDMNAAYANIPSGTVPKPSGH